MVGRGRKTFSIPVALESLIWHSFLLFQHQTQQYKQNLTNLNYVHGYFSIIHVWQHLETAFSDLNQLEKMSKGVHNFRMYITGVFTRKIWSKKIPWIQIHKLRVYL